MRLHKDFTRRPVSADYFKPTITIESQTRNRLQTTQARQRSTDNYQ